ncbi:amidohydrolase family protein [Streptomyces flaveolus]|uniref:Amidohydrolase family protein n=1 Tax=Streptomyces flaveolus TaxID=67297 RepID=A0ABV1VG79_9ACTN
MVLPALCGWAVVTGGHAFSLSWFDPFAISDGTAFAQGMVLAVFFFWGWDAAFSVTEETRSPCDSARGGLIALFAMLGLFLFASVAFQREMSLAELIHNGPQALPYLGEKLAAEPWATLPVIALLFSAVASVQASLIPMARGLLAALLRAQSVLHSHGVTAWQDAIVGAYTNMTDPAPAYRAALDRGLLTARVVGALWWDRERGAEQIPELVARREELTRDRFRATSVKVMQDGIAENHTAAMLDPYLTGCGCASDNSGISFVAPAELRKYVTELDAAGFQVHFHALGDRAVREALDAVQAAREANGWRDTRHHLAHLQVVHPADVPRFRTLGATANLQMLWAAHEPQMDELTLPFLGAERGTRQYPFGDLLRAGATLAAGSDWPVSSPDPFQAIHVAVNRIAPEAPEGTPVFLPGQRLDLGTAVAAYTAGSAYANHLDDITGSITVGKAADLVVLDRDPFAGPPEEIAATRVLETFVAGRRVHAAPGA